MRGRARERRILTSVPPERTAATLQRVPRAVAAMAKDFPHGYRIARDRHLRGQLIYATSGVMTVTTPHGTWVVPPQRAVWVPPETDHESVMSGRVEMRTLYIRPDAARRMPPRCCVVNVSPLLRELIVEATRAPLDYDEQGRDGRLMRLVLDEIAASPALPLHLPQPADKRLCRICDAIARDPADAASLSQWARRVGASERTLARLFARETGMRFTVWRQQARLLAAVARLAAGETVTRVALESGYASPSAFTAMFRRTLGVSPREYLRGSNA